VFPVHRAGVQRFASVSGERSCERFGDATTDTLEHLRLLQMIRNAPLPGAGESTMEKIVIMPAAGRYDYL